MDVVSRRLSDSDKSAAPSCSSSGAAPVIFEFLHPRDLLNLARTTGSFRAFLMSRTSALYWKRARQSVEGLPDCPPHLSEPAYANLVFFPHCHNCLTGNIHTIIYEFSARYCRRCKKHMLIKADDAIYELFEYVEKITGMNEEFVICLMGKHNHEDTYFHAPEWGEFRRYWATLSESDLDAMKVYIQTRVITVNLVKEWAGLLLKWKDLQEMRKVKELARIRAERFQTLLVFLKQEGWEEELEFMISEDYTRLSEMPFARKPSKLTARSWLANKNAAHAFMADVKAARLRVERMAVLNARFNVLAQRIDVSYRSRGELRHPEWDMDPQVIDFAFIPSLQEILDAPGDNTTEPPNIVALIECATLDWKNAMKVELVERVRAAVPDLGEVSDPLFLATAIFSCNTCCGAERVPPLHFPELLAHPCLRYTSGVIKPGMEAYVATVYSRCDPGYGPLTLDCLKVDLRMVQSLRSIIEAMGLNSLQATRAELDSSDVRLVCSACRLQGHTSGVMYEAFDWMRALTHSGMIHAVSEALPCSWAVLDPNLAGAVRLREDQLKASMSYIFNPSSHENRQRFGCRLCPYSCLGTWNMMSHLEKSVFRCPLVAPKFP
ncbi:hypothetical protein C2E23DRAFT_86490 [Lenzites betulinus]|nr:hypothetical protein C2E23DRAFT_86490 [Lenzites betulinus]